MKTHAELIDQLGEGEIAYISHEFWNLFYPIGSTVPNEPLSDRAFENLLSFQNGWAACVAFYKDNIERSSIRPSE